MYLKVFSNQEPVVKVVSKILSLKGFLIQKTSDNPVNKFM